MKKVIVIVLCCISITAIAQQEKAIFCKDSAGVTQLTGMAASIAKNKYHLEKARHLRYDSEIWYRQDDVKTSLLTSHFRLYPDYGGYVLINLDGSYEDVFPFWKKYFNPNADINALEKGKFSEIVAVPFLNGTAQYRLHRINNQTGVIQILKFDLPPAAPKKKQ